MILSFAGCLVNLALEVRSPKQTTYYTLALKFTAQQKKGLKSGSNAFVWEDIYDHTLTV